MAVHLQSDDKQVPGGSHSTLADPADRETREDNIVVGVDALIRANLWLGKRIGFHPTVDQILEEQPFSRQTCNGRRKSGGKHLLDGR